MSDDKKSKKDGDSGKQSSKPIKSAENVDLRRHEVEKQRQREEWSKIEKRGAGAGDRPKKS